MTADIAEGRTTESRAEEEARLRSHIASEPGFRVTTIDGGSWICPYTLTVVPVPFVVADTAVASLLERRPWARHRLKSLAEIQLARWHHWLQERFASEPRLRFYGPDGRWLDPFSGTWVAGMPDPASASRDGVITALARHLVGCPAAQGGRLISSQQLAEIVRQARNATRGTARTPMPAPTAPAPATPATTLHRARNVIERMLPPVPSISGFALAVHYAPLQEVGGDFYDFIDLGEGRLLVVLADVAGHGPEAALVLSAGLKALRMLAPVHGADLVELLVALNDNLRPDLPTGHFITCWAAVLDQERCSLTTVCAGHHPALLCNLERQMILHQVGRQGTAIGVVPGALLRPTLQPETIILRPGDLLLQFTDGLNEVHDSSGREYGRLRVMGSCVSHLELPPAALVSHVVADARRFADGPLPDDLTVMALATVPRNDGPRLAGAARP
jgi:serine phosphatase RsbU (regulator of sigma subunit)